jgi:uncharacterized protein
MIVVSDSTIIIVLSKINKLDILCKIFNQIYIPKAVYEEIVVKGSGKPGSIEVVESKWIKIKEVDNKFAVNILLKSLDIGESESIVLAKEMNADYIIIDEHGRTNAEYLGLKVIGTLGILKIAYERKIIKNFKNILDEIIDNGFYLKYSLYKKVLQDMNLL